MKIARLADGRPRITGLKMIKYVSASVVHLAYF